VDGKKIEIMFIDDIMVYEEDPEKQPQPEVVTPRVAPMKNDTGEIKSLRQDS